MGPPLTPSPARRGGFQRLSLAETVLTLLAAPWWAGACCRMQVPTEERPCAQLLMPPGGGRVGQGYKPQGTGIQGT